MGTEDDIIKRVTNVSLNFDQDGGNEKEKGDGDTKENAAPDDSWKLLLEDPTLADDDKFSEYLRRNAKKLLKTLEDLAQLGELIKMCGGSIDVLEKEIPSVSKTGVADWWGKREDACLLMGCYKHGMGRYEEIKNDPSFVFSGVKAVSEAEESVNRRGKGKDREEDEWPSTKALNMRFKRLVRAVEQLKLSRRMRLKMENPERKQRTQKIVKEWSKREKQDFYKALITHGVPYDSNGEYCWAVMQKNANLFRKTPKAIEKHYVKFLEKCRNTIRVHKKKEKKGTKLKEEIKNEPLSEDEEEMSYTQAMKVLQRIIMFSKIRTKVLALDPTDLKHRLQKQCKVFGGLPKWWVPAVHDLALLKVRNNRVS